MNALFICSSCGAILRKKEDAPNDSGNCPQCGDEISSPTPKDQAGNGDHQFPRVTLVTRGVRFFQFAYRWRFGLVVSFGLIATLFYAMWSTPPSYPIFLCLGAAMVLIGCYWLTRNDHSDIGEDVVGPFAELVFLIKLVLAIPYALTHPIENFWPLVLINLGIALACVEFYFLG